MFFICKNKKNNYTAWDWLSRDDAYYQNSQLIYGSRKSGPCDLEELPTFP